MTSNQRQYLSIIAALVILTAAYAFGRVYLKKPLPSASNSSPSEVEGWKTYRSEEYGFEFRYPKEADYRGRAFQWGVKSNQNLSSPFLLYLYIGQLLDQKGDVAEVMDMTVSRQSEEQYLQYSPTHAGYVLDSSEEFVMGNAVGKRLKFKTNIADGGIRYMYSTIFTKGNLLYEFYIESPTNKDYFDLILSTFKFLK